MTVSGVRKNTTTQTIGGTAVAKKASRRLRLGCHRMLLSLRYSDQARLQAALMRVKISS